MSEQENTNLNMREIVNAENNLGLIDLVLAERGKSWAQLIDESGVDCQLATRLIREGHVSDPEFSFMMTALLRPLGLTTSQATRMRRSIHQARASVSDRKRKIELLVRQFIIKFQPPIGHRVPLIHYCIGLAGTQRNSTVSQAARTSPPWKIMDVAHIYAALIRIGFFGKER
jgi:hypothetical protein